VSEEVYTADAVALLRYLVDALPDGADELFRRAESDNVVLQVPNIAVAETLYTVRKRDKVKGVPLAADAEDVVEAIGPDVPVTVVEDGFNGTRRLPPYIDDLTLHDAMVVVSHEVNGTKAVITADGEISEYVDTVWD
jgi:predicted nucleic acid-binding protein